MEHTWPLLTESQRTGSLNAVRIDRHKLVAIAADRAIAEVLLRITYKTNGIRSTQELLACLLDLTFDAIRAQRAGILLLGYKPDEFVSATYSPRAFPVSGAIARQALRDRAAVWANDRDSLMCVPLRLFDQQLGVLVIEHSKPNAFDKNDLDVLIAISSIASLLLQHTSHIELIEDENQRLREENNIRHDLVGEGTRMADLKRFISKAGPQDSTVLILGQSGTGKELLARALHRNSRRAAGPFIPVNCAAITESLVESELFGAEKGAFTGAMAQRKGKIEAAHGGTLFLDEAGELSMNLQAALLRFLQEREFFRVGGTRPISVDVRVIAATNRNLEERVREGRFREDLYFRLKVVGIRMPSLAERREDIPILSQHFIKKYQRIRTVAGISPEAQRLLSAYRWPGNVRELEHAIQQALVLGESNYIIPDDLPSALTETASAEHSPPQTYHPEVNRKKRQLIYGALEQSGGNIPEAARILDVSHSYLHRLIRNLNIQFP
jgi:transcriptional regulator with GAF, ATPase, and Fis domain